MHFWINHLLVVRDWYLCRTCLMYTFVIHVCRTPLLYTFIVHLYCTPLLYTNFVVHICRTLLSYKLSYTFAISQTKYLTFSQAARGAKIF